MSGAYHRTAFPLCILFSSLALQDKETILWGAWLRDTTLSWRLVTPLMMNALLPHAGWMTVALPYSFLPEDSLLPRSHPFLSCPHECDGSQGWMLFRVKLESLESQDTTLCVVVYPQSSDHLTQVDHTSTPQIQNGLSVPLGACYSASVFSLLNKQALCLQVSTPEKYEQRNTLTQSLRYSCSKSLGQPQQPGGNRSRFQDRDIATTSEQTKI